MSISNSDLTDYIINGNKELSALSPGVGVVHSLWHFLADNTAKLGGRWNATRPISRLPTEVITLIILDAAQGATVSRLRELASVTTRWWRIIISVLQFWTHISSTPDAGIMIRKSGTCPLSISFSGERGR